MIELPVFPETSSKFVYDRELETKIMTLYFEWNARSENWYLSVSNESESTEINSQKIMLNFPMLWKHKALFPTLVGDLIVLKVNEEADDLGYFNFGTDYLLYYMTNAEFETWKSDNNIS